MRPINAYLPLILNTRIDVRTSRIDFTIFWLELRRDSSRRRVRTYSKWDLNIPFRKRNISPIVSFIPWFDVEQYRLCRIFRYFFLLDVRKRRELFAKRPRFVEEIHGRRSFFPWDVGDGHVYIFENYRRARRDLKRIYERNNALCVGAENSYLLFRWSNPAHLSVSCASRRNFGLVVAYFIPSIYSSRWWANAKRGEYDRSWRDKRQWFPHQSDLLTLSVNTYIFSTLFSSLSNMYDMRVSNTTAASYYFFSRDFPDTYC